MQTFINTVCVLFYLVPVVLSLPIENNSAEKSEVISDTFDSPELQTSDFKTKEINGYVKIIHWLLEKLESPSNSNSEDHSALQYTTLILLLILLIIKIVKNK